MKSLNRVFLAGCVLIACLNWGCGSKKNTPEDATLKDNRYTNRFFALQIEIPKTWTLVDKPSKNKVRTGAKTAFGFDNQTAAAAADGFEQAHFLLAARNLAEGGTVAVTALNLKRFPEVKSGQDYLDQMRTVIVGDGKPFQQVNPVAPVKLASHPFHRLDVVGNIDGARKNHSMFAAVEKGYALMILVSAKTEKGVDEVLTKLGIPANQQGVKKPDPSWFKEIKLQGVSGTADRRLAIINGRTFAAGDTASVKVSAKSVTVRCIAVGESSATITIDGLDGNRELQFARN